LLFGKARLAKLTMPELEQSRAAVLKRSPPPTRFGATSTPSNGSSNGMSGFSPLWDAQQKLGRQIVDVNFPYHSQSWAASLQKVLGQFARGAGFSCR
jgi:hypothetical protein